MAESADMLHVQPFTPMDEYRPLEPVKQTEELHYGISLSSLALSLALSISLSISLELAFAFASALT